MKAVTVTPPAQQIFKKCKFPAKKKIKIKKLIFSTTNIKKLKFPTKR